MLLNEIFLSEIFAPICSFEYADHHDLIRFGQKEREDIFFDRSNKIFYTAPCPGPGTESSRLMTSLVLFTHFTHFFLCIRDRRKCQIVMACQVNFSCCRAGLNSADILLSLI